MQLSAVRRFLILTPLILGFQLSLPAKAHAGCGWDPICWTKAVVKDVVVDHPAKTVGAVLGGAAVGGRIFGIPGAIVGGLISGAVSVYQDLTASPGAPPPASGSNNDPPVTQNPRQPVAGANPRSPNPNPAAPRTPAAPNQQIAATNQTTNPTQQPPSQSIPSSNPIAAPDSFDPGSMNTGLQTTNTDARWGTSLAVEKKVDTNFFSPAGKREAYIGTVSPGVKGLTVPDFYAGAVCTSDKDCADVKRAPGPGRPAGEALAAEQGSWGGSSGRSGGGSPSADVGAYGRGASPRGEYSPAVLPDGSTPNDSAYQTPAPDDFDNKLAPLIAHPVGDGSDKQQRAAELLSLAMEELNGRDFEGAIEALTRALKLDSRNPNIYAYRAMAYNLTGNFAAAEKDALAAIKLDPNNEKAWESLAWAQLKQGRYAEAAQSATKLMGLNPKNALAYAIRAFAREKLGDNKGKLADIKRAATLDRRYVDMAQKAKTGRPMFDPRADFTSLLIERGMPPYIPSFWGGFLALFIILSTLGTFAALLRYVYLFKKGRVHDFKDFLAKMIRGQLS